MKKKSLPAKERPEYARQLTIRTIKFIGEDIQKYNLSVEDQNAIAFSVLLSITETITRFSREKLKMEPSEWFEEKRPRNGVN